MNIKIQQADWQSVMQGGLVVTLECAYFRGSFRLEPTEVGVPQAVSQSKDFDALVSLGRKRVSPDWFRREAGNIESMARRAIRLSGYRTPFGRFIPADAWPGLSLLLASYEVQFKDLVSKFRVNLDQECDAMLARFDALFESTGMQVEQKHALLAEIQKRWPSPDSLDADTKWAVSVFRVEPLTRGQLASIGTQDEHAQTVSGVFADRLAAEAQVALDRFSAGFRAAVAAFCERAGASLAGKRRMTARGAERMRNAIARLRRIDMLGDIEAQAALTELTEAIGRVEGVEPDAPERAAAQDVVARLAAIAAEQAPDLTVERFAAVAEGFERGVDVDPAALDAAVRRVAALMTAPLEADQDATAGVEATDHETEPVPVGEDA